MEIQRRVALTNTLPFLDFPPHEAVWHLSMRTGTNVPSPWKVSLRTGVIGNPRFMLPKGWSTVSCVGSRLLLSASTKCLELFPCLLFSWPVSAWWGSVSCTVRGYHFLFVSCLCSHPQKAHIESKRWLSSSKSWYSSTVKGVIFVKYIRSCQTHALLLGVFPYHT